MPGLDMDFCSVCDQAHNNQGSLYCSAKCYKQDAETSIHVASQSQRVSPATSPILAQRTRSSTSLDASVAMSHSTARSAKNDQGVCAENSRDQTKMGRPLLDRRHSSQRPLPALKRSNYSSGVSRSVDLVTPIVTPLTARSPTPLKVSNGFTYPIQPAGTRYNHTPADGAKGGPDDKPRRMFFFKKGESQEDLNKDP